MTALSDTVQVQRRFTRSARLDADLSGAACLDGYVMQASISQALATLAASQIESRQGAYNLDGPYGGGKSSAALLVVSLLSAGRDRALASEIAGSGLSSSFAQAFPRPAVPGRSWR